MDGNGDEMIADNSVVQESTVVIVNETTSDELEKQKENKDIVMDENNMKPNSGLPTTGKVEGRNWTMKFLYDALNEHFNADENKELENNTNSETDSCPEYSPDYSYVKYGNICEGQSSIIYIDLTKEESEPKDEEVFGNQEAVKVKTDNIFHSSGEQMKQYSRSSNTYVYGQNKEKECVSENNEETDKELSKELRSIKTNSTLRRRLLSNKSEYKNSDTDSSSLFDSADYYRSLLNQLQLEEYKLERVKHSNKTIYTTLLNNPVYRYERSTYNDSGKNDTSEIRESGCNVSEQIQNIKWGKFSLYVCYVCILIVVTCFVCYICCVYNLTKL